MCEVQEVNEASTIAESGNEEYVLEGVVDFQLGLLLHPSITRENVSADLRHQHLSLRHQRCNLPDSD